MALTLKALHPLFAAEATGIDLKLALDQATIAEIDAAMDHYAVLVFRDQALDQGQQIAFSKQFGPLDAGLRKATGAATRFQHEELIDIGNIAMEPAGEILHALCGGRS
jgi:alpha-ketoglutarate-dependent 2,4-dichlorophenoxyacetate dioxygenase